MRTQVGKIYADRRLHNWSLAAGVGARFARYYVKFPHPYRRPPAVEASLWGTDAHHDRNLRLNTHVEAVSRDGFVVRFNTWSDSVIFGAGASWVATPKIGDDVEDTEVLDEKLDMEGVEESGLEGPDMTAE